MTIRCRALEPRYEAYCLADPVFYESPVRGHPDYAVADRPLPDSWQRAEQEDWLVCVPAGISLPAQGWKIHASSTLDGAEGVLDDVWDYCVDARIPFKFIRSERLLLLRNSKYADRSSSGKLVTIYPADEEQFERILRELDQILGGRPGPYILSDLRWGSGPLYVRYGGFVERSRQRLDGHHEPLIEDGEGALVPDTRKPTFEVPPWVTLPKCLEPHLAARSAATVEEIPYRIESALHFSNGGGLYLGEDPASEGRVILKEARPHAGLSADGADAVSRLDRERRMLERLAGLEAIPALRDHFKLGDHAFLVRDHVEGATLGSLLAKRHPLTAWDADETDAEKYADWVLERLRAVERVVDTVHERGIVIGDLHPANLLLRPDGEIALIDLEAASDVSEGLRPPLAEPSFGAPPDRTGFDIDRYALACMRLWMFMPFTSLLRFEPTKARQLAREIAALFPVPDEFLAEAVRCLEGSRAGAISSQEHGPELGAEPPQWRAACESMTQTILASATPDRDDRLFPGDVDQFRPGGGVNLAHGAAGVLLALDAAGVGCRDEHVEWLIDRTLAGSATAPLGFYDGLHGVAYGLHRLGRRDEAAQVLEACLERFSAEASTLGSDMLGGLTGIGLNLLHFGAETGDRSLVDGAAQIAETVAGRLGAEDSVPEISGGEHPSAGLMRGPSGAALLFLRLHDATADDALLDLARTALGQDLRRCVPAADGALHLNQGWRTNPYLAEGSLGIGVAIDEYLARRPDEELAEASRAIRLAALAPLYIEPGLFQGRAGVVAYLCLRETGSIESESPVAAQARPLSWHALRQGEGLVFPGRALVRLSMDLATGTAGVMLALGAALREPRASLPLLDPLVPDRRRRDDAVILATEGR